ncbi:hypothetical protein EBO34_02785 [Alteribacter keqinensis]|uniref:Uncharacterized protein n=1 Tax=Alteribacter keqinensis TaxID=2483800 RepID=A0A3M7TTF4_9BACI|nr:hypothetical protein EBO34_02785 [Alteribacter keqinensis]
MINYCFNTKSFRASFAEEKKEATLAADTSDLKQRFKKHMKPISNLFVYKLHAIICYDRHNDK